MGMVLALCGAIAQSCIQIQRTGGPPDGHDDIDRHCRVAAEDYRERARAYSRCMNEHGFPHVGADDY